MNEIIKNRKIFIRKASYKDGDFVGFYDHIEKPLYELDKYIVNKNKSYGIWLNQLKPGLKNTHKIVDFDIPYVSWMDIDFKRQEQIDEFKNDIGNVKKLFEELQRDEHVFLFGRSNHGGIRLACLVDNFYDTDEDNDIDYTNEQERIYEINQYIFYKYMCDKYNINPNSSYADPASDRLSQPTFPLRKVIVYNINCKSLLNTYNIKQTINISNKADKVEMKSELILKIAEKNDKFLEKLISNGQEKILEVLFDTYNPRLMSITKYSKYREIWYNLFLMYYKGKSFKKHLKDLDSFNRWFDEEKSLKSCGYIENILEEKSKLF